MPRRDKPLSQALVISSGSSDSGSHGRVTPPADQDEESSLSFLSSTGLRHGIYNNPRCQGRQFWMTASSGSVVNLMGYALRHGRGSSLVHLAKLLHNEPIICGFEAPLRGLLFAAFYYPLNRRLLEDLAVCVLPLDPLVRTGALLESLLLMLQNQQPITNWADTHAISREKGRETNPLLAIFHGYVALQRVRELTKLQSDPELLSGTLTDDERAFREVALSHQRALVRKSLEGAFCVPKVVGDVFLQMGLLYEQMDEEFNFEKVLKSYIKRNPNHLTGFLFYCQLLRQRQDVDSSIRRLACIRKILVMAPADTLVLDYAETILDLGEVADFQDVADRLATYLDHWERRACLRGWRLLAATLLLARKYDHSVEFMSNRKFWWKYHFRVDDCNCEPVTLAKALVVSLLTGPDNAYVRATSAAAANANDGRLEHALKITTDAKNFRLDMFVAIVQ
ncbi:uncharacterized protein LOC111268863 isoform X2 [Varroa jacobsoni]|uniref:uncharacterized protein LOC111268863 isoform X2 n=1 Tax=Varroa jacobsoni TaxID=62625 RepID=UPI000BF7BC2D|nr:uncharacterized protein LOC111268863 isoform X2 [Varroa jacobsoni]